MATTPTAIRDRSIITLTLVKLHCHIDDPSPEDPVLQIYLDGAKSAADRFCNNPFLNPDGSPMAIPSDVEVWILKSVDNVYQRPASGVKLDVSNQEGRIEWNTDVESLYIDMLWELLQYQMHPGFGVFP
jgi:hypothetical protein